MCNILSSFRILLLHNTLVKYHRDPKLNPNNPNTNLMKYVALCIPAGGTNTSLFQKIMLNVDGKLL